MEFTMMLLDWITETAKDGDFMPLWYPIQSRAMSNYSCGKYISPNVQSEYLCFKLWKYVGFVV